MNNNKKRAEKADWLKTSAQNDANKLTYLHKFLSALFARHIFSILSEQAFILSS